MKPESPFSRLTAGFKAPSDWTQMNVAYLSNSSQIGGGEKCLESLFLGLQGTGVEPFVICPDRGPFVELLEKMGVKTFIRNLGVPSRNTLLRTLSDFLWLRSFLRKNRIDLFHANGSMGGRQAGLAARWLKLPVVCHIHYPLSHDYYRWVYRGFPAPQRLVFVCDALQRDLGGVLGESYPQTKQEVVYNGIDTNVYAPLDVDNPVPRIGIIANLQAVKGHEDYFEMASMLVKAGFDATFELIGDDVQKQGRKAVLEKKCEELGIREKVKFHGFVSDVTKVLQQFDIVVVASHEEASPRCIIESMSCRKPIVSTDVNGIPDVLEHGINGLLVKPRQPQALYEQVRRVLEDKALRKQLAYAGWRKVNEKYSLQAYTREVLRVYDDVLAPTGRPPVQTPP
jgi:glycosyltransferase involved in cell wall biosynthesis